LETHKEAKDHTKIDDSLLWGSIDTDNKEPMTDLELEFLEQSDVDSLSNIIRDEWHKCWLITHLAIITKPISAGRSVG